MGKIKFSIVLMLIFLVSCKKLENINIKDSNNDKVSDINIGQVNIDDSDSINLLKLKTECDCIDAGLIVAKEIISYDNEKLTSVQQDRVSELKIKLEKIIDLSRELGNKIGTVEGTGFYLGKIRNKWSFFSCENFEEFDKINPIHEAEPPPKAAVVE